MHHYDSTGTYDSPYIGGDFSSGMYADAAVDFFASVRDDKRPFLAYVAFTSPHDPRNVLPDYGRKYCAVTLAVPDNFLPEHPFDNGELDIRDEMVLPAPRTEAQIRSEMALYYGMVSEVDLQIGRVLDALEKSGRKDNTILVFASDNGLAMGQNGLLGKQSLYQHSVGVPLAIVDFRNPEKRMKSDALCYLSDIYPTLCEMAGFEIPESVQSSSLLPLMDGKADKVRDDLFLAYSNQQRALVKDSYKYIMYNVGSVFTEQLFNLEEDPGEMKNLASEMPEKAAEMKALLAERMKESGDFCDADKPLWWEDGHKMTWDEITGMFIYE